MLKSFYTAAVGAMTTQKWIGVTANNISNVSTNGYKSDKATFGDLLHTSVRGNSEDLTVGHGSMLQKTDTVFSQGAFLKTERTYDFALTQEDSFFAIQNGDRVEYTKNGNFHISNMNETAAGEGVSYLVNAQGCPVLSADLQPVVVDATAGELPDIGVFRFENTDGLQKTSNCCFIATERSGEAQAAEDSEIMQGFLESSSVDLATEITEAIIAQRAFSMNVKMVQTSDEIMQTLNSLR